MSLGATGLGSAGLASTGGSGLPIAAATIVNGDIIFLDQLDDPLFAVAEHDRTGTLLQRFVNGDDSTPNYGPFANVYAQSGADVLISGYRDSTNTGNCIFKISSTGALSDFILNAAISDLDLAFAAADSLAVDNTGRIYAIYVDGTSGVARRFNADGTFDADFTISQVTLGASFASIFLQVFWTISPDGRYIYGVQNSVEHFTFTPHGFKDVPHNTIYSWDTESGMATTLIRDYIGDVGTVFVPGTDGGTFQTGEQHTDLVKQALGCNPNSGELFVPIYHRDQNVGATAWTHSHRVERLQADGTFIQSYDISGSISGWTDVNNTNFSASGDIGNNFGFDAIGSGHAWIFAANVVTGNTHTWLVSIDLGNGAIATAANYVPTSDHREWLVVYSGSLSTFPSLARYPAKDAAPLWGHDLVGPAA